MKKKYLAIFIIILLFLVSPLAIYANETDLGQLIPKIGWWPTILTAEGFTNMLEAILSTIIGFLTILAGLYFMVNFIIGGLGWASAGGEMKKVEDARMRMTNAAVGLIIVVASLSIFYIVGTVLGIDILNIGESLRNLSPSQQQEQQQDQQQEPVDRNAARAKCYGDCMHLRNNSTECGNICFSSWPVE
jgi:hypothetical protein